MLRVGGRGGPEEDPLSADAADPGGPRRQVSRTPKPVMTERPERPERRGGLGARLARLARLLDGLGPRRERRGKETSEEAGPRDR